MKKREFQQHTVKKTVRFCGVGLHSGRSVNLAIKPAEENNGIRFVRSDLGQEKVITAFMDKVVDTRLATTIAADGAAVSTTEHLLAALAGLGIDNAVVEVDDAEVPIMDGSAGPFVHILKKAGRKRQNAHKRMLKITKEINFKDGDTSIRVLPHDGMKVTCEIDFDHDLIQRQSYSLELSPKRFAEEIATARTFGFMDQVEQLQENGLALGGSLENAIVVDRHGVINKEGLRFADEFVRHKVLDLIGDFALLGYPLLGHVIASKPGHAHHLGLMKEIAAHPECWEFVKFEKHGEDGVLEKVVTSTKAAGNRILPYLVPPSPTLARKSCPV